MCVRGSLLLLLLLLLLLFFFFFSRRSTPGGVPRHSFSDFGPKCCPPPLPQGGGEVPGSGPIEPRKIFEAFCIGVGNFFGLGGSKYRRLPVGTYAPLIDVWPSVCWLGVKKFENSPHKQGQNSKLPLISWSI